MAACWGQKGGRKGKRLGGAGIGDSPESVYILTKHGCQIMTEDHDGNNAIHISASTSALGCMKVWNEVYGPEVFEKPNQNGLDCMFLAAEYGHLEILVY